MKKTGIIIALLASVTLALAVPASASAKTVTVKEAKFTSTTAEIKKTARTVKRGTVTVKIKKTGFLTFKAPSKKKYSFTVSKLLPTSGKSTDYRNGFAYIMAPYDNKYSTSLKFTTQGGTTSTMWFRCPYRVNDLRPSKIESGTFIPSRTAKLTLKKGQTVYLYFNIGSPSKFNLKIK